MYYGSISSLDCSSLTALQTLTLPSPGMRVVTGLVSKNLTSLDVSDCPLSALDITALTALQYFSIGDSYNFIDRNALTSIDLSKNTELLDCNIYTTPLTSVDLTNNTKIQYLTLQTNISSYSTNFFTPLTSLLYLSLGPYVRDLTINNTTLQSVNINYTALSSFNTLNCPSLEIYYIYDNNLTTVIPSSAAVRIYAENNDLTTISVSSCKSLNTLQVLNNFLTQSAVDQAFIDIAANVAISNIMYGYINVSGTNAAPSSASTTARNFLLSKNWSIITN